MEDGDYFCISINETGRKTTKYFGTLLKVCSMLTMTDRYLLTNFSKLKQRFSHILHNDTFSDKVIIEEVTAYDDKVGRVLRHFMKSGKELIWSSLEGIETISDLDALLKKLSALVYKTQEDLKHCDFLDVTSQSTVDKFALARLLDHIWQYVQKNGSVTTIRIESLTGSPRAIFHKEPPLREWLPEPVKTTADCKFELSHVDFEDNKKWKVVLYDYIHNNPIAVEINDLLFLESLKSTDENEVNGILHGDIFKALYTSVYDQLTGKTSFKINEVRGRWRQSQFIQIELPFADDAAPPKTSSRPDVEKPPKKGKKKHNSWR